MRLCSTRDQKIQYQVANFPRFFLQQKVTDIVNDGKSGVGYRLFQTRAIFRFLEWVLLSPDNQRGMR
jgi:hypothetical protein